MQWLETDFLQYINDWEHTAQSSDQCTTTEKKKMCLSEETIEGIRITGTYSCMQCTLCMKSLFICQLRGQV